MANRNQFEDVLKKIKRNKFKIQSQFVEVKCQIGDAYRDCIRFALRGSIAHVVLAFAFVVVNVQPPQFPLFLVFPLATLLAMVAMATIWWAMKPKYRLLRELVETSDKYEACLEGISAREDIPLRLRLWAEEIRALPKVTVAQVRMLEKNSKAQVCTFIAATFLGSLTAICFIFNLAASSHAAAAVVVLA